MELCLALSWPSEVFLVSSQVQLDDLTGVSDSCRELLASMLQTDPEDRADVWSIMNHPWFQMDCPEVSHLAPATIPRKFASRQLTSILCTKEL